MATTRADIQALAARFASIGRRSSLLSERLKKQVPYAVDEISFTEIQMLSKTYRGARYDFQKIAPKARISLDRIRINEIDTNHDSEFPPFLEQIAINCETALGYLKELAGPSLSVEDKDKLDSLRRQIADLEGFNENLFKHVTKAIEEYEHGHHLASALLAGKATVYVLEQLEGKDDESKADSLVKLGLLDTRMKPDFLKGARKARNYFTHDLSAIAESHDAIGMIGDACDLSLKLIAYKTKIQRAT